MDGTSETGGQELRAYEPPALREVGTLDELTRGAADGSPFDAN